MKIIDDDNLSIWGIQDKEFLSLYISLGILIG